MADAMTKKIKACAKPVFFTAKDGVVQDSTCSFLKAKEWHENGQMVYVGCDEEHIWVMRIGAPIDGDNGTEALDPSEPYGTVHHAKDQHSYYINLPDELLE